jgi:hypothetical protein
VPTGAKSEYTSVEIAPGLGRARPNSPSQPTGNQKGRIHAYRSSHDSSLEGSGFELPVPRCALIANSAALVAPPNSAVRGGSLNGAALQPRSVMGGNCSADPPRGPIGPTRTRPENLGNRAAANYRFLNGSAASAVCPDRWSRVTKSSGLNSADPAASYSRGADHADISFLRPERVTQRSDRPLESGFPD